MDVVKRDGRIEQFSPEKIKTAVLKSFYEVDNEITPYAKNKAAEIARGIQAQDSDLITVEQIQDLVEEKLMASDRKDVARAYVNYRYLHEMARNQYKDLMDIVEEKLMARNVANQNANVDERSFGGRVGEASSAIFKRYALDHCMSEMARGNHERNEIYIHDLDSYAAGMHNCLSVPFDDLLANGFDTRQTDVRPAGSVNTAFQLVAVLFQIQSLMQFGGVSATHLDWTMVPYVRKSFWKHYKDGLKYIERLPKPAYITETTLADGVTSADIPICDRDVYTYDDSYVYAMDMTEREVYQAAEGLFHNLKVFGRLNSNVGNKAA